MNVTDLVIEYVKYVIEPPGTESPERLKTYLRHFIPKMYGLSERLVEWAWAQIDWEAACESINNPEKESE